MMSIILMIIPTIINDTGDHIFTGVEFDSIGTAGDERDKKRK